MVLLSSRSDTDPICSRSQPVQTVDAMALPLVGLKLSPGERCSPATRPEATARSLIASFLALLSGCSPCTLEPTCPGQRPLMKLGESLQVTWREQHSL